MSQHRHRQRPAENKKIHLLAPDGSSRYLIPNSTENILSQNVEKGNGLSLNYADVCRWIRSMLEAKEDVAIIVEKLYKAGVLKYVEWNAINFHF